MDDKVIKFRQNKVINDSADAICSDAALAGLRDVLVLGVRQDGTVYAEATQSFPAGSLMLLLERFKLALLRELD